PPRACASDQPMVPWIGMGRDAPAGYSSGSTPSARVVSVIVNGASRRPPATPSHVLVASLIRSSRDWPVLWVYPWARSENAPEENWAAVQRGTGVSEATG